MASQCFACLASPAVVRCSCDCSLLCGGCLNAHYQSAPRATHTFRSISAVEVCSDCRQLDAVVVCCCVPALKKLCEDCRLKHRGECGDEHELPIEALDGRDAYKFHSRHQFLLTLEAEVAKARLELAHKKQDIERFYSEVFARVEEFRERDRAYFSHLQGTFDFHFASILERIRVLRTSWPAATSHIVDELLAKRDTLRSEDISNALKLFSIDIDLVGSIKKLEFAVEIHYENSGPSPELLYFFPPASNTAVVYDVVKGYKRTVKGAFPLVFKQDATWCVLPNNSIFYCGGFDGTYSKEVMLINLIFKNGSMLPPMLSNRKWGGVAYHDNYVYVFGGCAGVWLRKCERFSLRDKVWEPIADMNEGRAVSGPTFWKQKFILCGYSSIHIELFDILSGSFFTLPQILASTQDVLSFVHDEDVVFLQKDKLMQLNLESNEEMKVSNIGNLSQTYTKVVPVKVGMLYYYADDRGRVWSIDVDSQLANVVEALTL